MATVEALTDNNFLKNRHGVLTTLSDILSNDEDFNVLMVESGFSSRKMGDLHRIIGGYKVDECDKEVCPIFKYCEYAHKNESKVSLDLFEKYWQIHNTYVESINSIIFDKGTRLDFYNFFKRDYERSIFPQIMMFYNITPGNLHEIFGGFIMVQCKFNNCTNPFCNYKHSKEIKIETEILNKIRDYYLSQYEKFIEIKKNDVKSYYEKSKVIIINGDGGINTNILRQNTELKDKNKILENENETLRNENETLQNKNEELQYENEELQHENETLRNKLEVMESSNKYTLKNINNIGMQNQFGQQTLYNSYQQYHDEHQNYVAQHPPYNGDQQYYVGQRVQYPVSQQMQYPVSQQMQYPSGQQIQYQVGQQIQYQVGHQVQYPVGHQVQYPIDHQVQYPIGPQVQYPIGHQVQYHNDEQLLDQGVGSKRRKIE
jgi:hypothetical protein